MLKPVLFLNNFIIPQFDLRQTLNALFILALEIKHEDEIEE